jgi:hypothetical protein
MLLTDLRRYACRLLRSLGCKRSGVQIPFSSRIFYNSGVAFLHFLLKQHTTAVREPSADAGRLLNLTVDLLDHDPDPSQVLDTGEGSLRIALTLRGRAQRGKVSPGLHEGMRGLRGDPRLRREQN